MIIFGPLILERMEIQLCTIFLVSMINILYRWKSELLERAAEKVDEYGWRK